MSPQPLSNVAEYGFAGAVIAAQFAWIAMLLRNNKMLASKVIEIANHSADRMEKVVDRFIQHTDKVDESLTQIKTALVGILVNGNKKQKEAS